MMAQERLHAVVYSNGFGTAGFIVSLISFFCCGLTAPLGLMMSLVALLWPPRGMAAAGVLLGGLGSWWLAFGGLAMLGAIVAPAHQAAVKSQEQTQSVGAPKVAPRVSSSPAASESEIRLPSEESPIEPAADRPIERPRQVPALTERMPEHPPAPRPVRSWSSANGKFTTEAEFVSAGAGKVKLRKMDGTEITVPVEQLSDDDRKWIADYARSK